MYGTSSYLDDFSGVFQVDSETNDYVIEKFSSGEKKIVIKNGNVQSYVCQGSKVGIYWIESSSEKWFYTQVDSSGNQELNRDLNQVSYPYYMSSNAMSFDKNYVILLQNNQIYYYSKEKH